MLNYFFLPAPNFSGMDFSSIQVPQSGPSTPNRAPPLSVGMRDDPAMIRDMLLANPDQLALLQQNNPALADAVLSGSLGEFHHVAKIYPNEIKKIFQMISQQSYAVNLQKNSKPSNRR